MVVAASPLSLFDKEVADRGYDIIAGVDEAGRGPLAGPVVAAACVFLQDADLSGINDSKQLTARQRCHLFEELTGSAAVAYGIGLVDVDVIDDINIYQATIQAMMAAVGELSCSADVILVDGMAISFPTTPSMKIVKGDTKSLSIAAASIIAKETRDRLMIDYDRQWPQYGFAQHKGYGTQRHREAIAEHGPCPIHRRTFEPIKSMLCPTLF